MIKSYEDLEVYKRSYRLALEMHKMTLSFPDFERYELGYQLRKASKSIPMVIGEGYGKRSSVREFKRFLTMAIGSCDEVKIILAFCKDLNYLDSKQYTRYREEYEVVGKMLYKLLKNWN